MKEPLGFCPFCGAQGMWESSNWHRIQCSNPGCQCKGPVAPDRIHALSGWNKRTMGLSFCHAVNEVAKTVRQTMASMEWPPQDGDEQIDVVLQAIYALKKG